MDKAEKLFTDSKLDSNVDLKACIACLTYIITSAVRYNCDLNALHSELQQLGLPREHTASIKRVTGDQFAEITKRLRSDSLSVNQVKKLSIDVDKDANCAILNLTISEEDSTVVMTPHTVDVVLKELKSIKSTMKELYDNRYFL